MLAELSRYFADDACEVVIAYNHVPMFLTV